MIDGGRGEDKGEGESRRVLLTVKVKEWCERDEKGNGERGERGRGVEGEKKRAEG